MQLWKASLGSVAYCFAQLPRSIISSLHMCKFTLETVRACNYILLMQCIEVYTSSRVGHNCISIEKRTLRYFFQRSDANVYE